MITILDISKSVQTEDLSKTADELPRNLNEMDDSDSDATEDLEVTNNKKEYTLKGMCCINTF